MAFLLVGGFNTLFGTLLFVLFQLLFESLNIGRFDYLLSLVCAQVTSIFTSYIAQRYLVFRVRGKFWFDLGKFSLVSMSAFAANLVLLPFCVELLGFPKIPAQLAVTAAIAIATYLAHRDFSFRRKKVDAPTEAPHEASRTSRSDAKDKF